MIIPRDLAITSLLVVALGLALAFFIFLWAKLFLFRNWLIPTFPSKFDFYVPAAAISLTWVVRFRPASNAKGSFCYVYIMIWNSSYIIGHVAVVNRPSTVGNSPNLQTALSWGCTAYSTRLSESMQSRLRGTPWFGKRVSFILLPKAAPFFSIAKDSP